MHPKQTYGQGPPLEAVSTVARMRLDAMCAGSGMNVRKLMNDRRFAYFLYKK
jgi:hypothetical protein